MDFTMFASADNDNDALGPIITLQDQSGVELNLWQD